MGRGFATVIASLAACVLLCVGARATQQPKTRPITYDRWGFTVNVPFTSVKEALSSKGAVELWDIFRFGDLVFSVEVTRTPPETLTATAIEQAIQAMSAAGASLGGAKRWELESSGGDLFKGLMGSLKRDETSPDAPFLKRSLGTTEAYRCLGMAAVGGESSPIVSLGVTGPSNRSAEIDDLARFFAFGFSRAGPKAPTNAVTPSAERPKKPAPAAEPARLKKGDIELIGRVEFIDAGKRSLSMIVDRIRVSHTGYIALDPPRRKIVYYRKPLPEGIDGDSTISVVGFNTGVGKPITADSVELVPELP
jgi:hypothetical protein